MARYWRMVNVLTESGALELSEAAIYGNGVLVPSEVSCSITQASGVLTSLTDESAASLVAWDSCSHPGFSIKWDLGVGYASMSIQPQLRLGSGSVSKFPIDLTLQVSDDQQVWTTYANYVQASFPGAGALSPVPTAGVVGGGDLDYNSVVLLVTGDSLIENSPLAQTLTATGDLLFGVAGKYGKGIGVGASGGSVAASPAATSNLGTGLFTLEGWFKLSALSGAAKYPGLVQRANGNSALTQWALNFSPLGAGLGFNVMQSSGQWLNCGPSYGGTLITDKWYHFALVRVGAAANGIKLFLDGLLVASSISNPSLETNTNTAPIQVPGFPLGAGTCMEGVFDDIRLTKGVARYTANFTVPAVAFPRGIDDLGSAFPVDSIYRRVRSLIGKPDQLAGASLEASAVKSHLREHPFFDVYNGGIGLIYGTVKEKHTPSNTPLQRKVLLIDEASQMTIRQTWSDAVTGNYEFRGVKQGVKYTVISYDHTGAYRAVIADSQIPELIV